MFDSDIITRCPQCNTAFRVTTNQLSVADGVVRCGSCLAVFKAIDYKSQSGETVTSIETAKKEKPRVQSPPPKQPTRKKAAVKPVQEELINDSAEETELSLDADIFELEPETKGKKTSLFERKLKPITQHTRESADESWALDMLAELADDDEVEPFQVKRKPQKSETAPSQPRPKRQVAPQYPPPEEPDQVFAEEDGSEALYFDPDLTEDNLEEEVRKDASQLSPSTEMEMEHGFSQVSDEEINNAMHSRTNYAGDPNSYLSSIEPAPVEMEWLESENTRRWLWTIGATMAGLLIVLQILIFRFDTLSKQPTYRSFYHGVCGLIGCQLPDLINTKLIRTTNLIVRSHPTENNALIVDAILINSAQYQQPFPGLRLEFSDMNNQLVAGRILQPRDYLRGELAGATQMPENQPIQLSLEIADPGETAVNYQLSVVKAANSE